jgi:hypothetical protein
MFSAWHEEGLDLVTEVCVKSRCLVRKREWSYSKCVNRTLNQCVLAVVRRRLWIEIILAHITDRAAVIDSIYRFSVTKADRQHDPAYHGVYVS